MFVRVVVNCGAGSVDEAAKREERDEITAAFEAAGATCEVALVPGIELERTITDAAAAAPDAVVVAGGDGTLGTAASVLAGGSVPLGVLPLGTFNHFAKDLGIPLDVSAAAAAIVGGTVQKIDVAQVNDRWFVNNASIGIYPLMVSLRDDIREDRGWGKVRAVPVASWRVLRRFPARRVAIVVDGERTTMRTPFVFVGNNRYDGGPSGASNRTSLVDGELCVYAAKATSRLRLVLLALAALVRGPHDVALIDAHCASEATIEAGTHRILVGIDGEVAELQSPLRFRVHPGALAIIGATAPD